MNVPPLVVLTPEQLAALVRGAVTDALDERAPPSANDGYLDRGGAARFLNISLTTLDLLRRREVDPLPSIKIMDSPRFDREELRQWGRRQPRGGS